ncbi:MAG: imidazolonepropionase [Nitrospinae bacterium RIFCSPLOWO2_12_FULL_45_22]|nr:MAG: imidazolonepropionase [Nitrospinae bacterium RIFCSPLOWO2_12_FULL_45_22]
MPQPVELIIKNADQLLTLATATPDNPLGIITQGSVAIGRDQVVWVGAEANLAKEVLVTESTRVLDAQGKVVIPGLIDAHTHLIFAGSRADEFDLRNIGISYQEIMGRGGGILATVAATRKASKEELYRLGVRRLNRALRWGTTTLEVKSGYGLSLEHELKMLDVIKELSAHHPVDLIPTFLGAHAIPEEYKGQREKYIQLICQEMIPSIAERKLAIFCDVFCEKGAFTYDETEQILRTGIKYGLKAKVHADEFSNSGGAILAADLGAVSADHLLSAPAEALAAMRLRGVAAVLLPGTSFVLGLKRYGPARSILAQGLTLALATDFNPGSCFTQSLPLIMSIACTQMHMTVAEAVLACTSGSAKALALPDKYGKLAPGSPADLLILDITDYRFLAYQMGENPVETVIKEGRIVIENRHLV